MDILRQLRTVRNDEKIEEKKFDFQAKKPLFF